jgi:hypothetical protein
MFHFPSFASYTYNSVYDTLALQRVGFPIQTSPDQRYIATSPKLIAGYHVFHRL